MANATWMELHQAIFGCWGDGWASTYLTWDQLFQGEGWPESWIGAAVQRVALREKLPEFATQHLQALREELTSMRRADRMARQTAAAQLPAPDAKNICTHCKDSGWACGLPHIQSIDSEGNWTGQRYTMACPCTCWKGRKVHESFRVNQQPVLSLGEYMQRNPSWRHQLQREELRKRAEAAAERASGNLQGVNRTREAVRQALENIQKQAGVAG